MSNELRTGHQITGAALLARVKAIGGPLRTGDQVTFVWEGERAELVGDFNNWAQDQPPLTMERLAPNIWARTLTLPTDGYFEYAFVQNGLRQPDPFNLHSESDGMGHVNSSFWMPDAVDTPLARRKPGVPRGTMKSVRVNSRGYILGATRDVHMYQPPTTDPVPLLVVFDGRAYRKRAKLVTIIENLMAQRRIQPIALAMVDPSGHGRTVEYACSDTTTAFVIRCVLPVAQEQLSLIDYRQTPGAFGLMGASMGGLMSLYIAHRAPEIFGKVLCQSGAFGATHLYYRSVLEDLIRFTPHPSLRIWQDVGRHEWFLDANRAMAEALQEQGHGLKYFEHNSGHNYPSWRNVLWRGLEYLYGSH